MGLLGVACALARRLIGEAAASALLIAACLALVIALPFWWRWLRARNAATLLVDGGLLRLRRGRQGQQTCSVNGLEPRTFRYRVGAGTYRVPAFILHLDGGETVTVGIPSSHDRFSGSPPEITRPDFLMEAADWEALAGRIRVPWRGTGQGDSGG